MKEARRALSSEAEAGSVEEGIGTKGGDGTAIYLPSLYGSATLLLRLRPKKKVDKVASR